MSAPSAPQPSVSAQRAFPRLEKALLLVFFAAGIGVLAWCGWRLDHRGTRPAARPGSVGVPFTAEEREALAATPVSSAADGDAQGYDLPCVPRPPQAVRVRSGRGQDTLRWAMYRTPESEEAVAAFYRTSLGDAGWVPWTIFGQKWSTESGGKASIYRRDGYMAFIATQPEGTQGAHVYIQIGSRRPSEALPHRPDRDREEQE